MRWRLFLFCLLAFLTPLTAQEWRNLTPADGLAPSPRVNPSTIYDPVAHRLVVFGGRGRSGDVDDVWSFDLASQTWQEITPQGGSSPTKRYTHNAVYDAANHRMIVWSGRHVEERLLFNDVWEFDLEAETWAPFQPTGPLPNIRYGSGAVYDPVAGQLVTFAGFTSEGRFNDTWRFDPAANQWTDTTPAMGSPGLRCLLTASYASDTQLMYIYGGQQGTNDPLADIWELDLAANTWTERTPQDSPAGRIFPTSIYDARNRRFLIFGGQEDAGNTNEVWAFKTQEGVWQALAPTGLAPDARNGSTAVYIQAEDRMIIFGGGGDGVNFNDVWSLDLQSAEPTAVNEAPAMTPEQNALGQNYPNPFNAETLISYTLAQDGPVHLRVYNLSGQQIRTLIQARQTAGRQEAKWDGKDSSGRAVASGVYLYRLHSGTALRTKKLLLLR